MILQEGWMCCMLGSYDRFGKPCIVFRHVYGGKWGYLKIWSIWQSVIPVMTKHSSTCKDSYPAAKNSLFLEKMNCSGDCCCGCWDIIDDALNVC